MSEELISRLRAALDSAEQQAQAATEGPWRYNPGKQWIDEERPAVRQMIAFLNGGEEFVGAGPDEATVGVAATGPADDPQSMADAAFIAAWDPARVLKLVERDRALLADYESARDTGQSGLYTAWELARVEAFELMLDRAAEFWLGEDTPK